MYRAVLEAKKKKPVVASMGDVAASGGYYAAMGADEIWALPTTLTGSIGVFFIKPALKGLAESLGANQVSIHRGAMGAALDIYQPWTDAERASVQKWIDDFYLTFTTEAAKSRHTTQAKIDAVARGHVWSGQDALAHGLIDHLGGLAQAIDAARTRANIPAGEPVDVTITNYGSGAINGLLGSSALGQAVGAIKIDNPSPISIPAPMLDLAAQLKSLGVVGVQTRLEYDLKVE